MRKEDIDWDLYSRKPCEDDDGLILVEICDSNYLISQDTAAIVHAILLLVDSLNDKDFK